MEKLKSIIVSNTAGDSLSEINLNNHSVENIPLDLGEGPVGPHGMEIYKGNIITANSYSNSISIIDMQAKKEIKNIYVGAHPNDIKVYKDKAYVICGESNSLIVIDMFTGKIIFELAVGGFPHSIEVNSEISRMYVANMEGNSMSIIDCENDRILDNITALEYPTKILLSKDKRVLYICESYLGRDMDGYISIISVQDNKIIKRIKVNGSPVNLYEEYNRLYVANISEGYISIVDIEKSREIKRIFVGGMPTSIIKNGEDIYIGNNMKGTVIKLNLKERIIKTITVGKEPNAMILFDRHQ